MNRHVIISHQDKEGSHQVVFLWETKKAGNMHDVLHYLINKFQYPDQFPKGYEGRPITTGDRITIASDTIQGKSSVSTYELATHTSYRRI